MTDHPHLATKAAFARLQGWSPSYVTALSKAGRLVLNDRGRVLVDASLQRIEETKDHSRQDVADRWQRQRAEKAAMAPETAQVQPSPESAAPVAAPGGNGMEAPAGGVPHEETPRQTYAEARALKEHFLALTAKAEYEQMIGQLCPVEDVRKAGRHAGALLRARLERLPAMLASELAASSDEATVRTILQEQIEHILGAISAELHLEPEERHG